MRRLSLAALVVFSLWSSSSALAGDKDKAPPVAQNPNECAVVKATARYVGLGYTHTIVLKNGCQRPVECTVWTDVDPEPKTTLSVRPGDDGEVVTRRGSPSREVSAFKQCSFR